MRLKHAVRRSPARWLVVLSATAALMTAAMCGTFGRMSATAWIAALMLTAAVVGAALGTASVWWRHRRYGTRPARG